MSNKLAKFGIFAVVAIITFFFLYDPNEVEGLESFAKCLRDKNIVMYGADWCTHCQSEKNRFGDSFKYVPYVQCPKNPQSCIDMEIKGYPTWVFPDGRRFEGEQGLARLEELSGCLITK